MIGLIFLVVAVLWLIAAIAISCKIPKWLQLDRWGVAVSLLSFPFVLTAPVADEIVGQWQFRRLCEREAKVILSADWKSVRRATSEYRPSATLDGYLIPIHGQYREYIDMDSGGVFMSYKAFHTTGGMLRRNLPGLGTENACWPNDMEHIKHLVDTDRLLKQGEAK